MIPPATLKASLWTRTRISNGEPAVKGLRCDTSSRPQRWFCSVLQTTHADLPNLGFRWNATSALGWTLLPQVKSTWNLEKRPEEPSGQVLRLEGDSADHLSASAGTVPWIRTISPGRSPPRMVPANGSVCGDNRLILAAHVANLWTSLYSDAHFFTSTFNIKDFKISMTFIIVIKISEHGSHKRQLSEK